MFDVAMLAAAPSTSLSVRWTWRVRYVALEWESHPFTAPRPPGKLLYLLLVVLVSLPISPFLSRSRLLRRLWSFAYILTFAYAHQKCECFWRRSVVNSLPRRPRSCFRSQPFVTRWTRTRQRYATHPIRYIFNAIKDAFFYKFCQLSLSDLSLQERSFHGASLLAFFNINQVFFSKFFKVSPGLD